MAIQIWCYNEDVYNFEHEDFAWCAKTKNAIKLSLEYTSHIHLKTFNY